MTRGFPVEAYASAGVLTRVPLETSGPEASANTFTLSRAAGD